MKIKLDEQNYVVGYCTIGDIIGSIEVQSVPSDFEDLYFAYQYDNGEFTFDESKIEEIDEEQIERDYAQAGRILLGESIQ